MWCFVRWWCWYSGSCWSCVCVAATQRKYYNNAVFYKVWKLVFFKLEYATQQSILLIANNNIIFASLCYLLLCCKFFFVKSFSNVKYVVVFFTFVFLTSYSLFYEKEKEIWKAWEIEYLTKKKGFYGIAWDFNFQHLCVRSFD